MLKRWVSSSYSLRLLSLTFRIAQIEPSIAEPIAVTIPVNIKALAVPPEALALIIISAQPSIIGIAIVNEGPIVSSMDFFRVTCGFVGASITISSVLMLGRIRGERLKKESLCLR